MTDPIAPLIIVVGPTASGKTELAMRIAERCGGEVVSADSVQVYREFDIGTSKPTREERERVPHHLIDIVAADAPMDAARWLVLADAAIEQIRRRGRRPIVCGGTFLWIRALVFGLAPAPPADHAIRAEHSRRAAAEGRAALWSELERVDPRSAERLAPNDLVRVSRALEVLQVTGTPLSELQRQHGFSVPRFATRMVGIDRTQLELSARIERRVHAMLTGGWLEEVRGLLAKGYGRTRPMDSVGYRAIRIALERGFVDLEQLAHDIDRSTRIFARRQRTWLRDAAIEWIEPGNVADWVDAARWD